MQTSKAMEIYKFYVQMDGQTFGPYTAREVRDLELLPDILVTEESMEGEWLPASEFDFEDMVYKESGKYIINPDGSITKITTPSRVSESRPIPSYPSDGNTSEESRHPDVSGWNWGAFFFSWLWGVFNGVYWPLIMIILGCIPYLGPMVNFIICISLGVNGNEWAWKGKKWDSLDSFKKVQHNWALAVLWVFIISVVCGFIVGISGN